MACVQVREKNSQKAPWKFLEGISLEELRFGAVPPTFQNALAKYDPAASLLTVTMDVRFVSNSAQAVVSVGSKLCCPSYSYHLGVVGCLMQD